MKWYDCDYELPRTPHYGLPAYPKGSNKCAAAWLKGKGKPLCKYDYLWLIFIDILYTYLFIDRIEGTMLAYNKALLKKQHGLQERGIPVAQ